MTRASPVPASERRAAILAVTERLIVAQGGEVSTRAIAKAAGIAEGTIFRVFPTKNAIIDAIFNDACNREVSKAELSTVDLEADLETRMVQLVGILQRRIRRIMTLYAAIGFHGPTSPPKRRSSYQRRLNLTDIARILEPDRDRLRLPPLDAARVVHAMVMALSSPMLTGEADSDPRDIVDLVLNGIALLRVSSRPPKGSSC